MTQRDRTDWSKLATAGIEVAVGIALGAVVGLWIDRKYHCSPWGVLIGTLLGCAGGMYLLIRDTIQAD